MRILVVEDEQGIAQNLRMALSAKGHTVTLAEDGHSGLILGQHSHFDLIILDMMLPQMPGPEVARRLRAAGCPARILGLSALTRPEEVANGLEQGCDSYLRKPFDLKILFALIEAMMRQNAQRAPAPPALWLDPRRRQATCNGRLISFSAQEFALLSSLHRRGGRPVERQTLLAEVWPEGGASDNALETYIKYLRRKLEPPGAPKVLHTVYRVGYQLGEPTAQAACA